MLVVRCLMSTVQRGINMGYAGMAMGVAGQLMQLAAAVGANKAMGNTYQDQLTKQGAYRNQATRGLDSQIAGSTAEVAGKQMAQGATDRQAAYAKADSSPLSVPTSTSTSSGDSRDQAYAASVGANRSKLGGYSDWALKQAIQNINAQRMLGQVENFAKGSAGVFPYQMYDAEHSQDTLKTGGQLLAGIGGSMGGMGGGGGGTSMPTAPAQMVNAGGNAPAFWSGYNSMPYGTAYNPMTNQNMAPQIPSYYN